MARAPNFDLAKELAKPSFTPGRGDASALVELVAGGDETTAARATPALAGLGDVARTAIEARFASVEDGARARLVGVLGLLARAGDAEARTGVLASMQDPSSRVRRAAAVALGKL